MPASPIASWYHSNRYTAQSACEHCAGVVRHERWCITCNAAVRYAYGIILEPGKMTLSDRLILHALGAAWVANPCTGACKPSSAERQESRSFSPTPHSADRNAGT